MKIPVGNFGYSTPDPVDNSAVSRATDRLGQIVTSIGEKRQADADRVAYMDADMQVDTAANDIVNRARNLQGPDAIGSASQLLSEFDSAAKKTATKLNPRVNLAYQEAVNSRRSSLQRQLDGHESEQREAYYAKSRADFLDQAHINAVTEYTDPKAINGEIAKIGTVLANTPGMDDAQRATELAVRRAGIYASVVDRYLANNQVGKARAYYNTVKDLAGDKAPYIENRIADAAYALGQRAKVQLAENRAGLILSAYASEGPDGGVKAMNDLVRSGKLSPEELGDVYGKVQQGLSLRRNAKQEEHADEIAELHQNLGNGSSGLEDVQKVEALWKDGALSPAERGSLIGQIEANHITKAGTQAAALALQDALTNGVPLSPSNADHRKVLAAAFGQDTAAVPVGSPQFQQLASAYAVKTRMLPKQAEDWAQAAVRSPNPKIAAEGAQFLGAVQTTAPDAVSTVDADTKAFAATVNQMIDAGTDPAEAIATARENVFNVKPPVLEARKKEYGTGQNALALGSSGALDSFIDRDFDKSWFSSQPEATLDLKADFNSLAEKYYLKTGDINIARDNAWRDVKRAYGPSEVNGHKQLMLMPPEKFGVRPEEVRKDIGLFIDANPQADGTTADDVIIVPDAQTMRSVNDIVDGKPVSPSYKMIGKSGDLIADKSGVPHRYYLPSGEEFAARVRDAQAKAMATASRQVDEARQQRANLEEFTRRTYEDYGRTGGMH